MTKCIRDLPSAPEFDEPMRVRREWGAKAASAVLAYINRKGAPALGFRDTLRWEIEFQMAVRDPTAYERYLLEELPTA